MDLPIEVIYGIGAGVAAIGAAGATAIGALWLRQVASERRCQAENKDLAARLRKVEDFQRDKLFALLTKAVAVLKRHGETIEDETPKVGHGTVGLLLLLMILPALSGCFGFGPIAAPALPAFVDVPKPLPLVEPLPVPAGESPEAKRVRELEDLADRQAADLDRTRLQIGSAKKAEHAAEEEARLAPVRAGVTWATWLGFLAGAAGVALVIALRFWQLPIGGRTAWALAVGGPAVACFAQAFGLVLPWLPWIGLGVLVVAGLVGLVVGMRRWHASHLSLAQGYVATAAALRQLAPTVADNLDEANRRAQTLVGRGVAAINDRVLERARKPAQS